MVLITGGSSDMAKPLIEKILNRTDYKVLVTQYKSKENYNDSRVVTVHADFSSEEAISEALQVIEKYEISHYVQLHGSALIDDGIESANFESMLFTLNINTLSTSMILSKLLPKMKVSGFGRVTLTSTASANYGGGKNGFSYGMSKHAINYIVKHMAKHYSEFGILTNGVAPGFIQTKFHTDTLKRDDEFLKNRGKSVKVGYAGLPEDVAELMFDITFKNSFMSGEVIKLDGADFI